jgi:hypothetical protein
MNSTFKNKNIIQGKQELLLVSLNNFYKNQKNREYLLKILSGEEKISLRIIDWFVTNYSKKKNIIYSINLKIISPKRNTMKRGLKYSKKDIDKYINQKQINVFLSYKEQLRAYSKKQFDPFCRRNRIEFYFNEEESITTTVGQLNFFRWAIQNNIINFILDNYKEIETDMNSNTRKKNDIINLETLDLKKSKVEENIKKKIRKKRKPLSVSASKNMNKNSYPVLLNFD